MKEHTEHIVFFRDLSPDQAEALARVFAADPDAARVFRMWRALREEIGHRLDDVVGDRELFALYVLHEYGDSAALTAEEHARAAQAAPQIREAIARHPGLSAAADEIKSSCDAFETTWNEWFVRETSTRQHLASETSLRARPMREESPYSLNRSPRRGRTATWGARVGIGAAVAVFIALVIFVLQRDHGMIVVETAAGETRTVDLGEGSSVRLLGDSRLSYMPPDVAAPIGRQVVLEGDGFFEVVPGDEGLVVKTEQAQLTVLGTTFGVQADETGTQVVLAQGRLSLSPLRDPARAVVLESGQMSRLDNEGAPTAPRFVRVHEHLMWTGLFVFSSTPLESILEELRRHYDVEISASEALVDEAVTGRFEHDQDLAEILQTVAAAVGAELQSTPSEGYRLVAR